MADTQVVPTTIVQYEGVDINELITVQEQTLKNAQAKLDQLPALTSDEVKAEYFQFRDKIQEVASGYQEERMPFTRKLDEIKKLFTTNENGFKFIVETVNKRLDAYAKKQVEEHRKKQEEADRKLKAEQDRIDLISNAKTILKGRIDAFLNRLRAQVGEIVKAVTKENMEASKAKLSGSPTWIPKFEKAYRECPDGLTPEDFDPIVNENYKAHKELYLTSAKQILIDSIDVLTVALTNQEEAARLMKIEQDRAEEAERVAAAQEKANAEGLKAIATLDSTSEIPPEPNAKKKMIINVLQNAGWLQLIAFWYEHDPEAKTKEDLSKKTFLQCKTFCEKICNTQGIMITHPAIKYEEDIKAKK